MQLHRHVLRPLIIDNIHLVRTATDTVQKTSMCYQSEEFEVESYVKLRHHCCNLYRLVEMRQPVDTKSELAVHK